MRAWQTSQNLCNLTVNELAGTEFREPLDDRPLYRALEAILVTWHADALLFRVWSPDGDYDLTVGFDATFRPRLQTVDPDLVELRRTNFAGCEQGMWARVYQTSKKIALVCRPRVTKVVSAHRADCCVVIFADQKSLVGQLVKATNDGVLSKVYDEDLFFALSSVAKALVQRDMLLSSFSKRHRISFWRMAERGSAPLDIRQQALNSPGMSGGESSLISTVSLAIDIRRSTFLMREAKSFRDFAKWIQQLTLLMRKLCHANGGVFDRFTGDGALAHFVEDDPTMVAPDGAPGKWRATWQALKTALEVSQAVEIAIEHHFRTNTRFATSGTGVGSGLAVDPAYWDIDRSGSPIVVGHGVVNATRLSSGPGGTLTMSLDAFGAMPELAAGGEGERVAIVNKDYPEDLAAIAVRMNCARASRWASNSLVRDCLEQVGLAP